MKLKQTGKLAHHTQPWTLIRDAVADLKLQEKTRGIVVNMGEWHLPKQQTRTGIRKLLKPKQVCHQCFAGCTLSRRCGTDTTEYVFPGMLDQVTQSKLRALDNFRIGLVGWALAALGIGLPTNINNRIAMPAYDPKNPKPFHEAMLALADQLEGQLQLLNRTRDKLAALEPAA